MTCHITLLTSASLKSLTKTFSGPDLEVQSFKIGKDFTVSEEPVSDLQSLSELLRRLESEPTQTIIRGSLIEGKTNIISRNKETFAATARQWCMIDIDSLEWEGDIRDQEVSSPIFQYHYFLFSLIRFQGRVVSFPRHGEV